MRRAVLVGVFVAALVAARPRSITPSRDRRRTAACGVIEWRVK